MLHKLLLTLAKVIRLFLNWESELYLCSIRIQPYVKQNTKDSQLYKNNHLWLFL